MSYSLKQCVGTLWSLRSCQNLDNMHYTINTQIGSLLWYNYTCSDEVDIIYSSSISNEIWVYMQINLLQRYTGRKSKHKNANCSLDNSTHLHMSSVNDFVLPFKQPEQFQFHLKALFISIAVKFHTANHLDLSTIALHTTSILHVLINDRPAVY